MITKHNYFKEVESIKPAELSEELRKSFEYVKLITEDYTTWEYYKASKDIKDIVDHYFVQLNVFLKPAKQSKPNENLEALAHNAAIDLIEAYVKRGDSYESIKSGQLGSSNGKYWATISRDKIKVEKINGQKTNFQFSLKAIFNEIKKSMGQKKEEKKVAPKKIKFGSSHSQVKKAKRIRISTEKAKPMEKIDEEVKFIKRYALLHNQTKTKAQLVNFVNALQRAIVEKRIRKTSPYAAEIKAIQNGLVNVCNKMKNEALIELEPKALERYIEIAGSEKIRLSTQYLKRFIGIHGKNINKSKAIALYNLIDKNIEKGNISTSDPYYERIQVIQKSLRDFINKAKANDTVQVHEQVLNGLNGILAGCSCEIPKHKRKKSNKSKSLGEIPVKPNQFTEDEDGIMTIAEARSQKFNTVPISGQWLNMIGEFCLPTQFFVYGSGGSGKTTWVLLFTQYLASLNYKILYVAGEQFATPTFNKLLNDLNIQAGDNFQITKDINILNPKDFDFVVLDSKDHLEIDLDGFIALTKHYPKQSFIVLSQGTKNKNFRGSERWRNTVDVMVQAENGTIRTGMDKNRWGGAGEMKVF